jgi:hypothetical protein
LRAAETIRVKRRKKAKYESYNRWWWCARKREEERREELSQMREAEVK